MFSKKLSHGEVLDSTYSDGYDSFDSSVQCRVLETCDTKLITEYTDWYRVYTADGVEHVEWVARKDTGARMEEVCNTSSDGLPVFNDYGGNSEGYYKKKGGSSGDDEIILIENEMSIINNLTNSCAKTIFNQLDNEMLKKDILQKIMKPDQNVNLTFAESILKLFNDSDTYNLSITNDNLKDVNGSTIGLSITI